MEKKRLIVGIHLLEHDGAVNSYNVHCSSELGFHLWKEKKESCHQSLLLLSTVWEFWKESTLLRKKKEKKKKKGPACFNP